MRDNTSEKVLSIAQNELGSESGEKYISYYNKITGASLPLSAAWCASWVTWVMRHAGVPTESVLNFKGCATASAWFAKRGRFKSKASGYTPKPGDIIMFEWSPENEGTAYDDGDDHTGLVERVQGGRVYTIEGNNGNKCRRSSRSLNDKYISGYCVPLYNIKNETEDEDMLSYEKFTEYMQRYEKERAERTVSDWAADAVKYCRENGIMVGDANGKIRPQSPITRQEAAQVVYNLNR